MTPEELGKKYSKISKIYRDETKDSKYGIVQIQRAISYSEKKGIALDVGCGAGGRIINELTSNNINVHGIDISTSMIELARKAHPNCTFEIADICEYKTDEKFELIVAWDSIFHIPLNRHKKVLASLAKMLKPKGILIYTFGDDKGEHTDIWHDDTFYYSSIGINENLSTLINSDLIIKHIELDQYPQNHVYIIAQKY
ncbi:Methyltransferase type 11 [Arcobacter nitrofigilis DSM 7299]|uniref:Methyltransferase type 11 n=1 Tax=Arcobacter nitrofigilis (strain ATCC 33309 / DSM 7299 / CCUG 15893 / LMG 7604 / NCTC 12251 / CI) TaxID=572480 RepID=D5V6U1_ARCNC|nr:class I SAM-dependent methyltransferase [Arcobacter nitrofigilis]ADG94361.1 Methyltransferase type 11 [Arcobacter nitrofigilis DSM 7299]